MSVNQNEVVFSIPIPVEYEALVHPKLRLVRPHVCHLWIRTTKQDRRFGKFRVRCKALQNDIRDFSKNQGIKWPTRSVKKSSYTK